MHILPLGKIVGSNSHVDYVCHVFSAGEIPVHPLSTDFAVGSFVRIELDATPATIGRTAPPVALVGLIYNTMLVNPAFGSQGPRLSPRADLEVFSPDYLAETATLVGVAVIGWQAADGVWSQDLPVVAASVNAEVTRMTDDECVAFHRGADGAPRLRYAPALIALQNPLTTPLLLHVIDELVPVFPAHGASLEVLRSNLIWRRSVEGMRGG